MTAVREIYRKPKPPTPECSVGDLSVIPSNVFSSDKNNVYHEFCKQWKNDKQSSMRVDASGKSVSRKSETFNRSIQPRTPPPDPKVWSNYDFELSFNKLEDKECTVDCEEAFSAFARGCRNTGCKLLSQRPSLPLSLTVYDSQGHRDGTERRD